MYKVPFSAETGFTPSLMPLLVAILITILAGVIGSKDDWGTKNSAEEVNIWRSLPDLIAFIELILSVASVTKIASSSKASVDLKLK